MNDRKAYSRISNGTDQVNDSVDHEEVPLKTIPQAPLMDEMDDKIEAKTQQPKIFLRNPLASRNNIIDNNNSQHEFQRLPSDDDDDYNDDDDDQSLTPNSNSHGNQSKTTSGSTTTYPLTEDTEEDYSSQHCDDYEINTNDEDDNNSSESPPPNPFEITNNHVDETTTLEPSKFGGDDDQRLPRNFPILSRSNSYVLSDDEDDDDYQTTNQFHQYLTPSKPTKPIIYEENFQEDEKRIDEKFFATTSFATDSPFQRIVVTPMKQMISNFQFEQERSRRRRIERLLSSLPDDDGRSKCHYIASKTVLCLSSAWCDLTDSRGWILLSIFAVTIFFVWYILENHPIHRKWILIVSGITLFTRIGYKPFYWFVWGRRAERRRKITLELYDGLNGENGTKGMEIPHDEIDQEISAKNCNSTTHSQPEIELTDIILPKFPTAASSTQPNVMV